MRFEIKSNELIVEDGKLQVKERKILSDKRKALIECRMMDKDMMMKEGDR